MHLCDDLDATLAPWNFFSFFGGKDPCAVMEVLGIDFRNNELYSRAVGWSHVADAGIGNGSVLYFLVISGVSEMNYAW